MEEKKYCVDCIDFFECMLAGRFADDEPCKDFQEETDPEESGNN